MEVFWRLPAINADPRQWNGPPDTKPKPRNCAPCPCLHVIAKPTAITRAPLCGIKVPRFFRNLSSYLIHCKALRSGLTARNCVQGLCVENLRSTPELGGAFLSAAHRPFRGPKARGIRSRPGSSGADQGLQKKEGRYLDHHSIIPQNLDHQPHCSLLPSSSILPPSPLPSLLS